MGPPSPPPPLCTCVCVCVQLSLEALEDADPLVVVELAFVEGVSEGSEEVLRLVSGWFGADVIGLKAAPTVTDDLRAALGVDTELSDDKPDEVGF